MTIIRAPFTPEQVEALNAYQANGYWHEFTCGRCSEERNTSTALKAKEDGWDCPLCEWRQDWAHDWMADQAKHPKHPQLKGKPERTPKA